MSGVETYLTFHGNCADALSYYEKTLGATVEFKMTFGESPMGAETPPDSMDKVMHSSMRINGQRIMASDNMPGQPNDGMHGFTLCLIYENVPDGEKAFEALSVGGTVVMPMQETFWVERWGSLVDRFGTPWMVNAGKSKMGEPPVDES
jgi:PhnB protein